MKNFAYLFCAILTASFCSCKSGEPVDLKLNLQPGNQYIYTMDTKTSMEQSAMGQTVKTNNDLMMQFLYDVAAGEGTNKKITVTYDRIAMSMKSGAMNMSYDSKDSTQKDGQLAMMGTMLHKPFTMIVSDKGAILKVEGLDAIINGMGDTSTPQGAAMRRQMSETFSDSAMKGILQQSLNFFPDNPVTPGDTWKKSFSMNISVMTVKMDNEFKLNSVSNGIAHIDVNSKLSGGGAMSGGEEMKSVQINLAGDQKGTMDVEVASGLVTDSKLKQNIKGDISLMGTKIPLTMVQDIHITARKK